MTTFALGLAVGVPVGAFLVSPWLTPYLWVVRALAPRPPGRHRTGVLRAGRPPASGVVPRLGRVVPWMPRGEAERVLAGSAAAGAGEGSGTAGGTPR